MTGVERDEIFNAHSPLLGKQHSPHGFCETLLSCFSLLRFIFLERRKGKARQGKDAYTIFPSHKQRRNTKKKKTRQKKDGVPNMPPEPPNRELPRRVRESGPVHRVREAVDCGLRVAEGEEGVGGWVEGRGVHLRVGGDGDGAVGGDGQWGGGVVEGVGAEGFAADGYCGRGGFG